MVRHLGLLSVALRRQLALHLYRYVQVEHRHLVRVLVTTERSHRHPSIGNANRLASYLYLSERFEHLHFGLLTALGLCVFPAVEQHELALLFRVRIGPRLLKRCLHMQGHPVHPMLAPVGHVLVCCNLCR